MNSVIICTYNRCESLRRTLASLTEQELHTGTQWELLIVDNNSKDATCAVVASFQDRLPVRHIFEVQQGLSHARNRGVQEAAGELVIFTDDDVLVEPDWLGQLISAARDFPSAGHFGGRIRPYWPEGRPKWYREESLRALGGLLVSHDLGADNRLYAEGEAYPVGACMGFRRSLLTQLGPFRTDLGTKGKKRGAGEDSEMVARAIAAGSRGVYVGRALCQHCVEPHRSKLGHAFEFGIQRGLAQVAMEGNRAPTGSLLRAAVHLARGFLQIMKNRGDRARLCLRNAGMEIGRRSALKQSGFVQV